MLQMVGGSKDLKNPGRGGRLLAARVNVRLPGFLCGRKSAGGTLTHPATDVVNVAPSGGMVTPRDEAVGSQDNNCSNCTLGLCCCGCW